MCGCADGSFGMNIGSTNSTPEAYVMTVSEDENSQASIYDMSQDSDDCETKNKWMHSWHQQAPHDIQWD